MKMKLEGSHESVHCGGIQPGDPHKLNPARASKPLACATAIRARIRDSRIAGYGERIVHRVRTHCSNFQPPGVERTPYSSAGSSPPPPGLTSAHQLDRPLRRPLSAPILHGGAIRGRAIQQARRHRSEQLRYYTDSSLYGVRLHSRFARIQ